MMPIIIQIITFSCQILSVTPISKYSVLKSQEEQILRTAPIRTIGFSVGKKCCITVCIVSLEPKLNCIIVIESITIEPPELIFKYEFVPLSTALLPSGNIHVPPVIARFKPRALSFSTVPIASSIGSKRVSSLHFHSTTDCFVLEFVPKNALPSKYGYCVSVRSTC